MADPLPPVATLAAGGTTAGGLLRATTADSAATGLRFTGRIGTGSSTEAHARVNSPAVPGRMGPSILSSGPPARRRRHATAPASAIGIRDSRSRGAGTAPGAMRESSPPSCGLPRSLRGTRASGTGRLPGRTDRRTATVAVVPAVPHPPRHFAAQLVEAPRIGRPGPNRPRPFAVPVGLAAAAAVTRVGPRRGAGAWRTPTPLRPAGDRRRRFPPAAMPRRSAHRPTRR